MKNLLARERDRRDGQLWCPLLVATTCRRESCAHYNPDTNECIHVEAAQAQVAIAKALLPVAAAKEPEQTGDIRQAVEWLNRGEFVRRKAWQTNDGSPMRLALPIGGNHLYLQVGQGPRRDHVEWLPSTEDLLATDWVVCEE